MEESFFVGLQIIEKSGVFENVYGLGRVPLGTSANTFIIKNGGRFKRIARTSPYRRSHQGPPDEQ